LFEHRYVHVLIIAKRWKPG